MSILTSTELKNSMEQCLPHCSPDFAPFQEVFLIYQGCCMEYVLLITHNMYELMGD